MGKMVGIRFSRGSKIYDFDAGHFVIKPGESVIVQTEFGLALGEVVRGPRPQPELAEGEERPALKQVYRMATEEDLEQAEQNESLEKEAYNHCQERIAARKLDMNLVKVECMFDRSKMIFFFTAEGRLDFRELVRDLVSRFRTRVEMRQIGVRHEAKLLGGLGSCGREVCCASFLKDFEPVSVKMAKEQNLSLNPTKISGLCGRLMCCLTYEFETYKALKKDLPKLGKRLTLGDGKEAKVIRQNVLDKKVTLYVQGQGELTVGPLELGKLLKPVQGEVPPAPDKGRPNGQGRGRGRNNSRGHGRGRGRKPNQKQAQTQERGPGKEQPTEGRRDQDQKNAQNSGSGRSKRSSSRRRGRKKRGRKGPKADK